MLNRVELKKAAKEKLKGKWMTGVAITFVYTLIIVILNQFGTIDKVGPILSIAGLFIQAPLALGLSITYIVFVKTDELIFGNLFAGFNYYLKSLGLYLWMFLWIFLWMLLLIIPGIVKAISYSMAYFIIAENPEVGIRDSLKISMKMTKGHKAELFLLGLSFLGWAILSVLTLFIGLLWLSPYMYTTFANAYLHLKETSIQNGASGDKKESAVQAY